MVIVRTTLLAGFPARSLATNVTSVAPNGKIAGALLLTVTGVLPSLAVAPAKNSVIAELVPLKPVASAAARVMFAGALIMGAG